MDLVLWILAMVCWVAAAFGTWRADPHVIWLGWVGFVLAGLTFIL